MPSLFDDMLLRKIWQRAENAAEELLPESRDVRRFLEFGVWGDPDVPPEGLWSINPWVGKKNHWETWVALVTLWYAMRTFRPVNPQTGERGFTIFSASRLQWLEPYLVKMIQIAYGPLMFRRQITYGQALRILSSGTAASWARFGWGFCTYDPHLMLMSFLDRPIWQVGRWTIAEALRIAWLGYRATGGISRAARIVIRAPGASWRALNATTRLLAGSLNPRNIISLGPRIYRMVFPGPPVLSLAVRTRDYRIYFNPSSQLHEEIMGRFSLLAENVSERGYVDLSTGTFYSGTMLLDEVGGKELEFLGRRIKIRLPESVWVGIQTQTEGVMQIMEPMAYAAGPELVEYEAMLRLAESQMQDALVRLGGGGFLAAGRRLLGDIRASRPSTVEQLLGIEPVVEIPLPEAVGRGTITEPYRLAGTPGYALVRVGVQPSTTTTAMAQVGVSPTPTVVVDVPTATLPRYPQHVFQRVRVVAPEGEVVLSGVRVMTEEEYALLRRVPLRLLRRFGLLAGRTIPLALVALQRLLFPPRAGENRARYYRDLAEEALLGFFPQFIPLAILIDIIAEGLRAMETRLLNGMVASGMSVPGQAVSNIRRLEGARQEVIEMAEEVEYNDWLNTAAGREIMEDMRRRINERLSERRERARIQLRQAQIEPSNLASPPGIVGDLFPQPANNFLDPPDIPGETFQRLIER
jgi:hypothetical protein